MKKTQLEFLQQVVAPALESQRDYGIPAAVTIAQAILESAAKVEGVWTWGGSRLFREANNPFGIKHVHHAGEERYEEFDTDTYEMVRGQVHNERAIFQHFPDLNAAFGAHAMLFLRLPRYLPARQVMNDWRKFAVAVMNCGYSTDRPELCKREGCPHYAGKLVSLVEQYRLDDPRALAWYAVGEDPGPGAATPAAPPRSEGSEEVKA